MTDQATIDHIIDLKQKLVNDSNPNLLKRKFDNYLEGIEINTPINNAYAESMSNRCNKLYVDQSLKLSNLRSYPSDFKVELLNEKKKRLVLNNDYYYNKKHKKYNLYDSNGNRIQIESVESGEIKNGSTLYNNGDDDEEDEYNEDEDPLASINLTEILAPIQHPADIITRKSINKVFNPEKKGNHLLKLAYDTIEMIESEQDNVIELSKLMNMFLGDEYQELTPENINLPDYDHKLSMKDLNLSIISDPKELFQDESENGDDTKEEEDDHKIQTRSKDNAKIVDPFFQLPNFKHNKALDTIDPQELEETRQLTQITLQRNQEYIRCLTKIRNGCVKVDKFKQNIFKWAKEMSGDYSEVDNVNVQSEESSVDK